MKRPFKIILLVVAVLLVALASVGRRVWDGALPPPRVVVVPELSAAARQGRDAFRDMPAQPGMPPDEVEKVTRYVRELQRANGIE